MTERNTDTDEIRAEYRDGCGASTLSDTEAVPETIPDAAYVYRNGEQRDFPSNPRAVVPDNEALIDTPLSAVIDHLSDLLGAFADRLEEEWVERLAEETGESRDMIRGDIEAIRTASDPERIAGWLETGTDVGDSLCRWRDAGGYEVTARPLGGGINVNAGHNLSAVVFPEMWRALSKNAVVHKIPTGNEHALRVLKDVYEENPNPVSNTCEVAYWPGGSRDVEEALFASDYVMAWGDDSTISAVRSRVAPTTEFVPFHFEFGVYLVGEAFQRQYGRSDLDSIAMDFSWGDQLLCYSPQLMLVERSEATDEFLTDLADAMEAFRETYAMGDVPDEEKRKIARSKKEARQSGNLVSDWSADTTVVRSAGLTAGDVHEFHNFRFVDARTVESLSDAVRTLGDNRHLQDFVLAIDGERRRERLRDVIAGTAANRITSPGGAMPDRPIPWDGKHPLQRLVTRVTDETAGES